MARSTPAIRSAEDLLREFTIYDRAVDIVSIYHWIFTEVAPICDTVEHFERYPKIDLDGTSATPDFTVLFKNGTGWVGEIANLARHEGSVESLCRQLDKYGRLTELPNGQGGLTPVSAADVVFLTPINDGSDAARRIFEERIGDSDHWYKPAARPVMIQFAQNSDNYVLQVWPDRSVNGSFASGGEPNYRDWTDLKPTPERFTQNKITYAFMNDPVPPLYLATRLWSNVFPSRSGTDLIETTTQELADLLQQQYRHGRVADVEAAMSLLRTAGLATFVDEKWKVRRRNLSRTADNVQTAIAELAASQRGPANPPRRRGVRVSQLPLFDLDEIATDEQP